MQPLSTLQPPAIDVITIQSQVVYGSVGNGIAYRTLLKKGLEAVQVPSVLLGCPPYYGAPSGGVIPEQWFSGFLEDLITRGVAQQARSIIVGYLGNVRQCHILACWLEKVIALNPAIMIVIDPVMGDYGEGVYVDKGLVDCYRSPFLHLANGITPNGFELEQLCQRPLQSREHTALAAKALLNERTQWVLVTSAPGVATHDREVGMLWVNQRESHSFTHPKIDAKVKGTGDMFTALLVSHLLADEDFSDAVSLASGEMCRILSDAALNGWEEIGSLRALE
ncbi:PfkB family carbohydrate kinase [Serratia sp. NPDC078593]|uniref:PfkB family carbohydrate kinase n=1 Tax=unclassified Serratia (in: enterobacteria) TaxID=2647522 RepID=UPI0037D12B09